MTDLAALDATAQAELVRAGHASPAELVDAAIARIEKLNPELNAVIHPLFDKARDAAAGALPEGPFRGVPMVVKDLTCQTEGDPYCEGTKFLKELGYRSDHDSYLAQKLRAAGFVIVGKTNTPEFGILPTTEPDAFGPTRNPWNTDHSTGGSSGGSAAAVASGMVPVGHANDGGGSIRIPASECALVGLKPTRGRTSLGPDFGDSLDGLVAEHVVTRSVRDTAAVLDAVHGPMPGDPYTAPPPIRPFLDEAGADPGRLRIGVLTQSVSSGVTTHPDCVAATDNTARLLESLGHHVEPADIAATEESDFVGQFITMWATGNAATIDAWASALGRPLTPDDVEPLTWALAELGRSCSGSQLFQSIAWLQGWSRRFHSWWQSDTDLLLTPTIAEPPPPLGSFGPEPDDPLAGLMRAAALVPFTPLGNVTGQPAISLPLDWNDAGLPIGVHLIALQGREDVLLRVAAQLEQARPWADRRPEVHA